MKYLKYLTVLPLVAALFLIAGCATRITSDVARFHRLMKPNGETFQIEPKDKAKIGSLEFNQYANLVGDRLVAVGYKITPPGAKPDLIVRLDYGVSNGQVRISSYPSMGGFYPYGYGFGRFGHPYWGDPFYPYGYGYQPEIRSDVYYVRRLSMDILRNSAPEGQPAEKLFEGRVESQGTDDRLPEVMPYLVQSMFDDFPGQSGVTKHVVLDQKK